VGNPFLGAASPYALSCDSHGQVFVGDVTGLYAIDVTAAGGTDGGLPGTFAGLTPPIYGVLAGD
jgi:hypothetical protein